MTRTLGALALGPLTVAAVLLNARVWALDWHQPWTQPRGEVLTAQNADEYAWRLFMALNWPADLSTRSADRTASFGADRPVVWEAWQNAGAIFLDDGSDPGPWADAQNGAAVATELRFENLALKDLPNAKHVVGGIMVPLADPLARASRLTEIRMNRASYEFIRSAELYNMDGQLRAYASQNRVDFPRGARDVKAKWRPIGAAERSRYHTVRVAFADGTTRLFGLTALHIASKDSSHWFWATFEHVDNPLLPDNEGWQLPSRDRFSCRDTAPDCNRGPHHVGLEGTVWQYYRLRGTLTGYVDGAGRPQLLANSELENGMQGTASCMTCHSRASIGVVAGAPARLPVLDPTGSEPGRNALARRGYVGLPKAEWFSEPDAAAREPAYRPLDFVWSLAKAKPKKTAAVVAGGVGQSDVDGVMPGIGGGGI